MSSERVPNHFPLRVYVKPKSVVENSNSLQQPRNLKLGEQLKSLQLKRTSREFEQD